MKLDRKIVLSTATVLLALFCALLVISTYNSRTLLAKQIELNTQSTANSLGLILSIPQKRQDKNWMTPLVSSVLNGGFYNAVQVLNNHSNVILNESVKPNVKNIKGVPGWFICLFAIPESSYTATANTSKGKVIVTAHKQLVYSALWSATVTLFWSLMVLYILTVLLSLFIIKMMLKPLSALSQEAMKIVSNHSSMQTNITKTSELNLIKEAMHHLSNEAQIKYEEELSLTERLYTQTYQEPVTGLGNRRYFDMQLQHLISEKIALGALFLIELQGLKEYNDKLGYQIGNELIQRISEVIEENCQDIKANFLSRIGGSTFAIITPHLSDEEVEHLANCLIHGIETLLNSDKNTKMILAHIGIASLSGIEDAKKLLTSADIALKTAQSKGAYAFFQYENSSIKKTEIKTRNASEWKKYIDQIISDNLVTVAYQPIMNFPDKSLMAYEALLRVKGVESNLTEARFIIPLADRFGLTNALDQCVMKQVFEKIEESESDIPFVINISASTLTHEESLQWLIKTLASGNYHDKLIFELDEHTVCTNSSVVTYFSEQIQLYGARLAVEHFGHDFSGLGLLKNLKLYYLKIDGCYIQDLNHQDTQFYIHFLTKTAHATGIKVIAECVETEEQWEQLSSFKLDGAQGRFLAPPEQEETSNTNK